MKQRRHFKGYVFVKLSCPVLQMLSAPLRLGANWLEQEGHLQSMGAGFRVGPQDTVRASASVSLLNLAE